MQFTSKKPNYEHLQNKWSRKHEELSGKLWEKHEAALDWLSRAFPAKQLALGSLGGLLLLSSPARIAPTHELALSRDDILKDYDRNVLLAGELKEKVPQEVRVLSNEEEDEISQILSQSFGFKVLPEVDHKRLNRTYGLIGGEQHLYRYPGDILHNHAETTADWAMFGSSGIAPGLGAWGYFTPSKETFTEKDKLRERYYLAVQTFLAPGFAENVKEYRDFFKFRKMLVVSPKTGQAVVAVIGDAGPAAWTGKHLGGSPEVMHYLGLATGPRKGPVLYFFIDDPEDKVPLGPIKVIDKRA